MKILKKRTILLFLLSFVCIHINAYGLLYRFINDNTEVEVKGIYLEVIKHDFGYIISQEDIRDVKTVEIPSFYDGRPVTSIGKEAFSGYYNLESVTLPSTLKKICESAFYGTYSLTSITIPNSVTSIGYEAFYNSGLTSIDIPNSLTSIKNHVFLNCRKLTSVTIPSSVTLIGESAFSGCSSLTSITIPSSVTLIGESAFYCCSSLTSLTFENSDEKRTIERQAFFGCPLKSIIFGTGTYVVGISNFRSRHEDCTVYTPNLRSWFNIHFYELITNPLYGLKNNLFVNGEEISGTLVVESPVVPNYTLPGQDNITSVVFSSDVEFIGGGAFYECKNLASITLSDGVREIERYAFSGTKLHSVIIPASIEYIGKEALGSLDYAVILKDTPPRVEVSNPTLSPQKPFYASVLYVPVGSKEIYKRTRPWNDYRIIEGVPSGIESVETGHADELGRYLLDGTKVEGPQKGLNIIRYSDGSTKKVMVK